jgi:hypothetical protein
VPEVRDDGRPAVAVQPAVRKILQPVEDVVKAFAIRRGPPPAGAERDPPENHHREVDDGCRQGKEVVVPRRDELADLVHEQAHADPGAAGRQLQGPPVGPQQLDHHRDDEQQTAPERVGEVERAAADPRVAGGGQEQSRDGDGDDERHDQERQVAGGLFPGHRPAGRGRLGDGRR